MASSSIEKSASTSQATMHIVVCLGADQSLVGAWLSAHQGRNLLQAGQLHQGLVALLMQVGQLQAALVGLPPQPLQLLAQLLGATWRCDWCCLRRRCEGLLDSIRLAEPAMLWSVPYCCEKFDVLHYDIILNLSKQTYLIVHGYMHRRC